MEFTLIRVFIYCACVGELRQLLQPFQCEDCGKRFTAKKSLRRHMKCSCPHGPYKIELECPYCLYTCGRPDNLKHHIRICTNNSFVQKVENILS